MKKTHLAIAALALVLAAGYAAPSYAEESRGGASADTMKVPRKKEQSSTRNPAAPATPSTKSESPKIIYF